MKIEMIDRNKLKVFITESDLRKWNFDLNGFEGNNSNMETLFWNIMEALEENSDITFDVGTSKISIEAISKKTHGVVMLITRVDAGIDENQDIDEAEFDDSPPDSSNGMAPNGNFSIQDLRNLEFLEKTKTPLDLLKKIEEQREMKECMIFKFLNFEQIVKGIKVVKKDFYGLSSIYKHRSSYFLVLKPYEITNYQKVDMILSEFGFKVYATSDFVIGFLEEYGQCMIRRNAVESIVIFF